MSTAKRLREGNELRQDQDRLFRDWTWVQKTALPVVEDLMKALMVKTEEIKTEGGLNLEYGYEPYQAGFCAVLRYGRVTLQVLWDQQYTNVIEDVALQCTEYNKRLYLQKERRMATREPTPLGQKQYFAVLNFARDLRWIDQEKPQQLLGNDEVIGKILDQLLSLVDRLNRGEVPSEDY